MARSLYHQRSGQALGQPYTSIERPRSFHPDDGTAFLQSTLTMLDNPNLIGIDDRFGEYPNSSTGETVSGAWGGHYDAGDWNSRIQHLEYLRVALDLVRLYPDTYANLELQIPESGDSIPDVVDEGLWSLDQFMRLQQGDGGIPGNIDQARFGEGEEASWDNDLDVFVFAPDMWSTYIYAGVAAKTALVLQDYDQERAEAYAQSATLAMDWAESQWSQQGELDELIVEAVSWERAGAATSMLALDGDDSWNDVVAEATPLDEGPLDVLLCHDLGTCAAVWEYSQLDPSLARQPMLQNSVESLRRNADAVLAAQETAGYAWVMELDGLNLVWGLGPSTPHGYGLLRAFVVTGDEKYRTAMVRGASFSLGGNPLNVSFATGLGSQTPRYPLIVDALHRGLPVWPGTFEFGIHDLHIIEDDSWIENDLLRPARTYPDPLDVPVLWSWYDVSPVAAMNEFTVSQSHAPAMWALGVLAATNN